MQLSEKTNPPVVNAEKSQPRRSLSPGVRKAAREAAEAAALKEINDAAKIRQAKTAKLKQLRLREMAQD